MAKGYDENKVTVSNGKRVNIAKGNIKLIIKNIDQFFLTSIMFNTMIQENQI